MDQEAEVKSLKGKNSLDALPNVLMPPLRRGHEAGKNDLSGKRPYALKWPKGGRKPPDAVVNGFVKRHVNKVSAMLDEIKLDSTTDEEKAKEAHLMSKKLFPYDLSGPVKPETFARVSQETQTNMTEEAIILDDVLREFKEKRGAKPITEIIWENEVEDVIDRIASRTLASQATLSKNA